MQAGYWIESVLVPPVFYIKWSGVVSSLGCGLMEAYGHGPDHTQNAPLATEAPLKPQPEGEERLKRIK